MSVTPLATAKQYLNIFHDDEDALIGLLVRRAEGRVEDILGFRLSEFDQLPPAVDHAISVAIASFYEYRTDEDRMKMPRPQSGELMLLDRQLNSLLIAHRKIT